MAIRSLSSHGIDVYAIGNRTGEVDGIPIRTDRPAWSDVDKVTLYLSAANQKGFYEYILSLKPKRVIFNPGAENPELEKLLEDNGIEPVEACTLVMLSTGQW